MYCVLSMFATPKAKYLDLELFIHENDCHCLLVSKESSWQLVWQLHIYYFSKVDLIPLGIGIDKICLFFYLLCLCSKTCADYIKCLQSMSKKHVYSTSNIPLVTYLDKAVVFHSMSHQDHKLSVMILPPVDTLVNNCR